MAMAHHCLLFQHRMIEFANSEARKFAQDGFIVASSDVNATWSKYIEASLDHSETMATWTLEQLHALENRLRVQGKVVSPDESSYSIAE